MREAVEAIEAEFRSYRKLCEKTFGQLSDEELVWIPGAGENSVATIAWHVGGNLRSRFTDFLTSDGEKPWRDREGEFVARTGAREELLTIWHEGWRVLEGALAALSDADLDREVAIRSEPHSVRRALLRSLAHTAYHAGQIVLLGRHLKGGDWRFLTIPPGGTEAFNRERTGGGAGKAPSERAEDGGA
ncbi:MAG: DUF1572 family protein [Holophagales bacterium]|nr:DUF1572 family protein [Holophagales bacterium]